MKIVKAMVHVEVPCVRCGGAATCMGLATVLPDGRIGGPVEGVGQEECNTCRDADRKAAREAYAKARQQRAWALKAERTLKAGGPK